MENSVPIRTGYVALWIGIKICIAAVRQINYVRMATPTQIGNAVVE